MYMARAIVCIYITYVLYGCKLLCSSNDDDAISKMVKLYIRVSDTNYVYIYDIVDYIEIMIVMCHFSMYFGSKKFTTIKRSYVSEILKIHKKYSSKNH